MAPPEKAHGAASETRTFTSPSGRTWTASVFPGAGNAPSVLRFRSGDVVLDLADFPDDWARPPDAALVALARRGEAPRFAPPTPSVEPAPPTAQGEESAGRGGGEETFADRMGVALLSLQVRSGGSARIERVSPGAFAGLVEARLRAAGQGRTVPPSEVVSWFADTLPDLPTVQAIAESCGVDPGWLGFGARSRAPAPVAARPTAEARQGWATGAAAPVARSP